VEACAVLVFDWEVGMPFLPWSIIPYWSIDLFYGLSLLLPRTSEELDAHAKRLFTTQIISVTCFIAFPLHFSFVRPETSGAHGHSNTLSLTKSSQVYIYHVCHHAPRLKTCNPLH
jgi:glucose dehydrogenase